MTGKPTSAQSSVLQAISDSLKGCAETRRLLASVSADLTISGSDILSEVIPKLAQLQRQIFQLKIELLSVADTEDTIKLAAQALSQEIRTKGVEWFVSYYKEAAVDYLTPKRRMALALVLIEAANDANIPPANFWLNLVANNGLLDHEADSI